MTNITTAWVVDIENTTLLFDDNSHQLANIAFAKSLLGTLKPHQYAKLNHTAFSPELQQTKSLPDLVIDYHALKNLNILKPAHEHIGFNGNDYQMVSFRHISQHHPNLANLASHAIQVMRWRNDNQYCPKCATPINIHHSEYAAHCPSCRHHSYPRVQPCIIVAITRLNPQTQAPEILLALHQRHKKDGMHGLIAGFVEVGETLESAIIREVLEEVGVNVTNPHYISSQAWPFPSNLMVGFLADYDSGEIQVQEEEIALADFFAFDNLPKIPDTGTIARDLIEHAAKKYGKTIQQTT